MELQYIADSADALRRQRGRRDRDLLERDLRDGLAGADDHGRQRRRHDQRRRLHGELLSKQRLHLRHTVRVDGVLPFDADRARERLEVRTRRLAAALREQGIGPGERVGLAMVRGLPLVESVLAVWEAGAAFVPLDPELPDERLRFMVEDAAPQLVLTDELLLENLGALSTQRLLDDKALARVRALLRPKARRSPSSRGGQRASRS